MLQVILLKFKRGLAGLFTEQPDEIGIVIVSQVEGDLGNGEPGMDQHAFGFQNNLLRDKIRYGLVENELNCPVEITLGHIHHFRIAAWRLDLPEMSFDQKLEAARMGKLGLVVGL